MFVQFTPKLSRRINSGCEWLFSATSSSSVSYSSADCCDLASQVLPSGCNRARSFVVTVQVVRRGASSVSRARVFVSSKPVWGRFWISCKTETALRVCEPGAASIEPGEIPRRANATCASNTSRTGRGKPAGDSGSTINGRRRGAMAFVGARTTLVGCSLRPQNHATVASTASANSQRQPPRLLRCGRDDEDLELRRTRRLSHRPDGDPRPKSASVQVQNRVADQLRGVIVIDQAGVDDHVVTQRIINVVIEILFQITFAAAVFVQAELARLVRGQVEFVVFLVGVFDAFFERSHQADMQHMRQFGRDHGAAAADEDHAAQE